MNPFPMSPGPSGTKAQESGIVESRRGAFGFTMHSRRRYVKAMAAHYLDTCVDTPSLSNNTPFYGGLRKLAGRISGEVSDERVLLIQRTIQHRVASMKMADNYIESIDLATPRGKSCYSWDARLDIMDLDKEELSQCQEFVLKARLFKPSTPSISGFPTSQYNTLLQRL